MQQVAAMLVQAFYTLQTPCELTVFVVCVMQMEVEVRGNVFEHQVVQLSGEAFLEEVALCGLQPGASLELRLPDTQLRQPVEAAFSMRNASAKHFRCLPMSRLGNIQY